ncbi:hypothetical protein [Gimesia aquarii]|uniref:Zinc-finger domain-containing protein n=1 Tax=Gimesia aquarii TaxID=2527964 RepID=A0A517WQE5_9PLAN|nr:hypothetical protein [Gimesia aquarii]QDU07479.1 hypothetical protein V202x_08350 [Gimesia aquarii]
MTLNKQHITNLLGMIRSVEPDELDCDSCYEQLSELAEVELHSGRVPDTLKLVEHHLHQCPCCKDEFNALLESLNALQAENSD